MRFRRRSAINDAAADGKLPITRQSMPCGTPGEPDCERWSLYRHDRRAVETKPVRMLLFEDHLETKQRIISAVCMTPADIHCVSTVTAGLFLLDSNHFDVIVIDRHLDGWVSAQSCRNLVARAGGKPTVGLINEDCVVDIQDAIEAGLTGLYYKDEMNVHLMRRLGRLAYLPSVDPSLAEMPAPSFGSARS
jgi:DNA-binding NarL/FixJ family response regulator